MDPLRPPYDILNMKDPLGFAIGDNEPAVVFESMPAYMTSDGLSPKFQKFYSDIQNTFTDCNWNELYTLSDRSVSSEIFLGSLKKTITNFWEMHIIQKPTSKRGCSLNINPSRLRNIHGDIVGGLILAVYTIDTGSSDICEHELINFTQYYTELLFTYKDGKFVLIPKFHNWVKIEE